VQANLSEHTVVRDNRARARPSEIDWQLFHDPHGRPTTPVRVLLDTGIDGDPRVLHAQIPDNFEVGLHWHPYDTVYIITKGDMTIGDEGRYQVGDVRWVHAGHVYGPEVAGEQGVEFFLVSLGGAVGLNWEDLAAVPEARARRLEAGPRWGRTNLNDVPWQDFDDPAGRPTQPVQLLCNDDPYLLRTRFAHDYSAGEHWHDYDTLYFITQGSMRFGDEGRFEPGDVRWVRGGHSYGPEEPGPEGVEFLLLSCGGPVALHWSDLEPPPKGVL
tara:strand:+ start:676 stop:1488 length:813 start_codon:yes stop_codon:yes gene_type:complete